MKFLFKLRLHAVSRFSKKGALIAFILACGGCVETVNSSLPKAVSLLSGNQEIIISAPKGFCVDQRLASKFKGSTTLFVIDCVKVNDVTGVTTARRPVSAILTATVIDFKSSDLTSIDRMEELLIKKPGINFLSRANTNALLKVHEIETKKGFLFFLIEQRDSDINVKRSNYFWRVFFFIEGRIISMTASNFSDDFNSQKKLKKLIAEFAKNTLAANIK